MGTARQSPFVHWTRSNLPRLGASLLAVFTVCAGVLATGCASRSAYVIARQNVRYPLSLTNKIAIAEHAHPRPEEQSLRTALMSELRQQGFNLVASSEAEYTLTYWIDLSWKRGKIVVSDREGTWADPNRGHGYPYASQVPPFFQTPGYHSEPTLSMQHVVEVPWETKGIRLKVFPQETMRAGNMQTAWDGYIEGGDQVSEEREPALVRTLLSYFGKDFLGRAPLITALPGQSNRRPSALQ